MSAYYNEIDGYAVKWLRNLISAGHIAPGDVDERSITDVQPDELRGYTQVHLFAGIGGWSLALRMAGWPDDQPVWTGSCPCQPFSVAGRGAGADDPRHLWPHMYRLIRECRPECVFGEQVQAAIGHGWLDGVCADLEGIDYAVGACVLGAHSVGAPHIRQRLWWCAERLVDPAGAGGATRVQASGTERATGLRPAGTCGGLADRACGGQREHGCAPGQPGHDEQRGEDGWLADAEDADRGWGERGEEAGTRQDEQRRRGPASGSTSCRLADAERDGRGPDQPGRGSDRGAATRGAGAGHWGNSWLPCSDGTARRVEPAIPPLAHGLPRSVGDLRAGAPGLGDGAGSVLKEARRFRKGALRGAGNAIVPQVAAEFIRAYMEAAT